MAKILSASTQTILRYWRNTATRFCLALFLTILSVQKIDATPAESFPADAEIKALLKERIDQHQKTPSIVVGLIDATGSRVVAYGKTAEKGTEVNARTLYEIGSITKTFTATLVADMVQRQELRWEDSLGKLLQGKVTFSDPMVAKITLLDLATHTSGLPRLPLNFAPKYPDNPYADYDEKKLHDFLATVKLTRAPGQQYEYSNLGMGLLGHLAAKTAKKPLATLLQERILDPLKMQETQLALKPLSRLDSFKNKALGHDSNLKPVANWSFDTLAGAGALYSNAEDLLRWLALHLQLLDSPLQQLAVETIKIKRPTNQEQMKIGLAWHVVTRDGFTYVFHNGATGGYASLIAFDTKAQRGVVVLTNAAYPIEDLGLHLLHSSFTLAKVDPAAGRKVVVLDPQKYQRLVGRYSLRPNLVLTISVLDGKLMAQATGQLPFELFAETENRYFAKVADIQIEFLAADQQISTGMRFTQNGKAIEAKKLPERVMVSLQEQDLKGLLGKYVLDSGLVLMVTQEGKGLKVQATNQPALEVFPASRDLWFYKAVEAEIEFRRDFADKAKGLVLKQNGLTFSGRREE